MGEKQELVISDGFGLTGTAEPWGMQPGSENESAEGLGWMGMTGERRPSLSQV